MGFRPRLLPTLILLPLLAALLALGSWQLDRREWKHELIATLEEREAAPPIALPERLEPERLEFRRVELTGELLHLRELYWAARTRDGVSGYHVLTPMRLADGREVILDRGWLPPELLERDSRSAALPQGEVTLVASARQGGWGGPSWASWLRPVNAPENNRWLWPDLDAMAQAARLERPVTSLYFLVEPGELPSPPEAVGGRVELKDDHLQYALFWFSMAGALILIYVLFHRRSRRDRPSE
ncbi:MAG TPA: SURF1 family protein [Kiloniellales bacterium]|nr:SURF1 family protein [Kiloniellales bacterium]